MLVLSLVCSQNKHLTSKQTTRVVYWFDQAAKSNLRICGSRLALSFLFCDERRPQEPLEEPLLSTTHAVCLSVRRTDILSVRQTCSVAKW